MRLSFLQIAAPIIIISVYAQYTYRSKIKQRSGDNKNITTRYSNEAKKINSEVQTARNQIWRITA